MVGVHTPVDGLKFSCDMVALYFTESEKKASSAVTRLRRSDFIAAMYAFSFVFANFGIAIAARIPMMTTTISSSMSVKPLRVLRSMEVSGWGVELGAVHLAGVSGTMEKQRAYHW